MKNRFIVPPPGPLAWLYPELEPLVGDTEWDLPSKGTVQVEDGPRGHALWTWLRQALRGSGVKVVEPSLHGDRCFESRLVDRDPDAELTEQAAEEAMKNRRPWTLPIHPGDRIGEILAKVSRDPGLFREAGLLPFFVTRLNGGRNVETRLAPSWWGILPGDAWPREERTLFHELFRLLHPDRVFLYRAFENYALAGIDVYAEGLMGRFSKAVSLFAKKENPPLVIGVCGTDGSGKSSHVAALKEHLASLGLKVCVHKIYRHGVFHETVTDLTRQCAGGKNLHLWRLQRIIKAFDSVKYFFAGLEEDLASHDVVLFDRYTFTHYAAGVGRYHHDPFARELLSVFPEPDRIYLLDVPTDEALKRIGTRDERTVDENHYMLSRYRHALRDLGDRHAFMILDATAPFEENRRAILDDATRLVRGGAP
jgi:dTMP kinase